MDQPIFLRDIDDWEDYAQGLHAHILSWVDQVEELNKLLHEGVSLHRLHEEMTGLYGDMRGILHCAADRARRLADAQLGETNALTKHKLDPDQT